MSELITPAHTRFAHSLRAVIQPDQRTLGALATDRTTLEIESHDQYFIVTQDPFGEVFAQPEAFDMLPYPPKEAVPTMQESIDWLVETDQRTTVFVDSLVESYCTRKNIVYESDNEIQKQQALARVFAGGLGKIREYMLLSIDHSEQNLWGREHLVSMPLTLMILGARLKASEQYDITAGHLEQKGTNQELDTAIDESMQAACQRIQADSKIAVPKSATPADKAFASTLNVLRTIYRPLKNDPHFHAKVFNAYGPLIAEATISPRARDNPDKVDVNQALSEYADAFHRTVGLLGRLGLAERLLHPSTLAITSRFKQALDKRVTLGEEFYNVVLDVEEEVASARYATTLVNGVADGSIQMSRLMKALAQTRKQPLYQPAHELPLEIKGEDAWVPWEILPHGFIEEMENMTPGEIAVQKPFDHEKQIDWMRLWRLQQYGKNWEGAYFARTTIEGLSPDKQYYAIILPDSYNGVAIEHAIADHPETGNGMYVWRGEIGVHDKEVRMAWQQVMSRSRRIARALGARRLYHTVNLEENLMAYLTAPAHQAIRRYTKAA